MSSTNKTNLGLNQWVLSDKPTMHDFNADNARIDELLGSRKKLAAAYNVFVAPSGSDAAGNGTQASPFATLQKAFSHIWQEVDPQGNDIVVYLQPGTYTIDSALFLANMPVKTSITGMSESDTANTVIQFTDSGYLNLTCCGFIVFRYLTFDSTQATSNANDIYANFSRVIVSQCAFAGTGGCARGCIAGQRSNVEMSGSTITNMHIGMLSSVTSVGTLMNNTGSGVNRYAQAEGGFLAVGGTRPACNTYKFETSGGLVNPGE